MRILKISLILAIIISIACANNGRRNYSDIPTGKKYIAITFDDGPNTTWTPQVLDKLKAHGAKATFYVQGQKITELTKPVMLRAIAEGNDIDNHSWDHPSFCQPIEGAPRVTTVAEARDNLQRASKAIFDVTGYWPWSFRAPFLEWDYPGTSLLSGIDYEFKMAFIDTGIDPADFNNQGNPSAIASNITNRTDDVLDGGIILLHDDGGERPGTVAALDILLPALKTRGFEVVTVRELFYIKKVTPELFVPGLWPRINQRAEKPSLTWRRWEYYDKIVNGGEPENIGRLYPDNMNNWWLQDWWTCPTPPWERSGGAVCGIQVSYTVSVTGGSASITSGLSGTTVTLTAGSAPTGKQFKEWHVVSGGVTITGNTFTIGTTNIVIEAVWEDIPVACEICGEFDCQKTHIWCEICEVYDCTIHIITPIHHNKPANNLYGIKFVSNIVSDKAEMNIVLPNNEKASQTNITVYDMTGNIVFNSELLVWDLRNNNGRIVANGSYLIVAKVKGINGNTYHYSAKLGIKR